MARIVDRFLVITTAIEALPAVDRKRLTVDERDHQVGVIRGEVVFIDGSCFRFVEHLDLGCEDIRRRYAYEYCRRPGGALVFRYDNVAHEQFEELETFPHHVHRPGDQVECAEPPDAVALMDSLRRQIQVDRRPAAARPVRIAERKIAG